MQVGSLGSIIFETSIEKILTPNSITREHAARYASHEVQGAPPRLEFLSRDLSSTSFGIRLVSSCGINPQNELEKLKKLCFEGKVIKLILGGINNGDVIIEKISEAWKHTSINGNPFAIDVNISLKEYL